MAHRISWFVTVYIAGLFLTWGYFVERECTKNVVESIRQKTDVCDTPTPLEGAFVGAIWPVYWGQMAGRKIWRKP